jgi:CRISPR-associated endonuclease Cas1
MIKENSSHQTVIDALGDTNSFVQAAQATYERDGNGPICVVDGMGLNIHVDRNHLIVTDGLGPYRRERRFHKATHGLSRLVVLGQSGSVSLDALRYCDRLGIALVVIDAGSSRVSFTSTPSGTDDARLRRVQALAPEGGLGVDIARLLIAAKLEGQAQVLRTKLGAEGPAESVLTLREQLGEPFSFDEIRQLEASAAACYFNAWNGSPLTVPKFAKNDLSRVPDHWLRYDGRRSVLYANNGNRKAERPVNAILNYLFALLEVESLLACHAVGLDPGMGVMHLDARGRQSMALDLMEPVRPLVEQWTLDLLANRSFKRTDFTETDDGHVRLVAPLIHELADTMGQWRKAVAPWAEKLAHLFGEAIKGKYQAATPLTGRNLVEAQRVVKSRKSKVDVYQDVFTRQETPPKQRSTQSRELVLRTCQGCGGPLSRGQHVNCPTCWESKPDQEFSVRKRRGEAIAKSREVSRKWREEHPGQESDPEGFRMSILPGLQGVTLSEIMRACGVARSTASMIRSGKLVPTKRHWEALVQLTRSVETTSE